MARKRRVRFLSNSSMSSFRTCPRQYYIHYVLGLTPKTKTPPLRIGTAFATWIELHSRGRIDPSSSVRLEDPYEQALVAAMVHAHISHWKGELITSVSEEIPFRIPIRNPETGRAVPGWKLIGKIDRIAYLEDGRLALIEYKTTSRDFRPLSLYWLERHVDQQISIYVIAARLMNYNIATIRYDVTKRPRLKPFLATEDKERKYKKDGSLYESQRTEDEPPHAYEQRVTQKLSDANTFAFARIEIPRTQATLDDCMRDIWTQQRVMSEAFKKQYWYRNYHSCVTPTWNCPYIDVCENKDLETTTPCGYLRSTSEHIETDYQ